MGNTLLCVLSLFLLNTLSYGKTEVSNEVTVTLQPDQSTYFSGESVTFICDMKEGEETHWEYALTKDNQPFFRYSAHKHFPLRLWTGYSGEYQCLRRHKLSYDVKTSNIVSLTVSREAPKATLLSGSTNIPVGGRVTLTCSVAGSAGWTYHWSRRTPGSDETLPVRDGDENRVMSISQGGTYWCRGGRGNPVFYTHASDEVTIQITFSNKVSVTLQTSWPHIFSGETITVRCEIQGGGDAEWEYEWRTSWSTTHRTNDDYWSTRASESHSGGYMCRGRHRSDPYSSTEWSKGLKVTVSPKPKAQLSADKRTIPAGGRVTLTCSVDPSSGWKYDWYRDNKLSEPLNTHDADFHTTGQISVSQGGVYSCRGGRGDPVYYTEKSQEVRIDTIVPNRAVVTLQPDWTEIYIGERISVSCEIQGGDTEWTYEWETTSSLKPSNQHEYRISSASSSHSGEYRCRGRHRRDPYSSTEWSKGLKVTVSPKPKAQLSADKRTIPAGGRVTLTCSVDPSSGWKYDWYRDNKLSEPLNTHDADFLTTGQISVSQGGVYSCRGGRGDPVYYTEKSQEVWIDAIVPNRAVVTLQPDWTEIYRGERISVSCEIQGGDTEWTYEWETTSSLKPSNQHEYRISSASSSYSGEYRCRGRMKSARHNTTEWSAAANLTVYDNKPRPVLTVSPSWLSPGASVTLKCEVEHPSAGWRFSWYKAVPDVSHTSYSYELLPGSSNGTEQDSYIVHGQTHTAGYVCEAGRGDPVFYTEISEPKFVWSGDVHPSASLTVSPDRVQHFIYDDISLSCEGNSTEWRVRRFPEGGSLSCSDWRRMTGSRCDMFSSQRSDAVYWCESGSGEFSNTVNITVHDDYHDGVILVSPVRPVTEGESVTLGCRFRTEEKLSSVFFYHNDKLIQNDTRTELNISAVSKSDEGFYKCQSSGKVSPQSWMSVKVAVPRPGSSSFPVWPILGLVCGIVLIVLLLLLYRCRQSKDLCFIRSIQSESTSSSTNHGTNQNESQHNDYASPLNGDTCIYDTIKDPEDAENGEPQDVTYSSIELKNIGKKHKHREPAETSVYSDIKTRPADNRPLYAQVNINTKEKAKKKKGKSAPAATDDSVYSEVKNPGTAFGL